MIHSFILKDTIRTKESQGRTNERERGLGLS